MPSDSAVEIRIGAPGNVIEIEAFRTSPPHVLIMQKT